MNWNLEEKNNFEEFLSRSGLIRKDKIKYSKCLAFSL